MNLIWAFENAFRRKAEKRWDYIYVAIDIHSTIFKPTYDSHEKYDYYTFAKETLRMMSRNKNVKLIIWSSSHKDALEGYLKKLDSDDIHIDYVNCNPEVEDIDIASFKDKFYFNVGIDDKFGFDANVDWYQLHGYFLGKTLER